MLQKRAVERPIEFYSIAREYRLTMKIFLINSKAEKGLTNAAMLQGVPQSQKNQNNKGNSASPDSSNNDENRGRSRKYVCGKNHLFRECPYINIVARTPNWKKDKNTKNQIKEKIKTWGDYYVSIKKIINIDILERIPESIKEYDENRGENEGAGATDSNSN